MAFDTGLGAVLTITGLTAGRITEITFDGQSRDGVSVATLADTGFEPSLPGDLASPGGGSATILFDPTDAANPTISAAVESIVVTWPSQSTSASLTGTGWVSGWNYPNLGIGSAQEASVSWTYDGVTGPTWAKGT